MGVNSDSHGHNVMGIGLASVVYNERCEHCSSTCQGLCYTRVQTLGVTSVLSTSLCRLRACGRKAVARLLKKCAPL